jgi:hypothetical protein
MYRTRIVNKSIIDRIRCLEMKPASQARHWPFFQSAVF